MMPSGLTLQFMMPSGLTLQSMMPSGLTLQSMMPSGLTLQSLMPSLNTHEFITIKTEVTISRTNWLGIPTQKWKILWKKSTVMKWSPMSIMSQVERYD